jgi:hypothetical protein
MQIVPNGGEKFNKKKKQIQEILESFGFCWRPDSKKGIASFPRSIRF